MDDWKQALDENRYIATILMDLAKAFDCRLPRDLLINKLKSYCLSGQALQLIHNYLSNKRQSVKVGPSLSNPRVQKTRYGFNSFIYFAAKAWNDLPDHFRKESSFSQFKNLIKYWNGK